MLNRGEMATWRIQPLKRRRIIRTTLRGFSSGWAGFEFEFRQPTDATYTPHRVNGLFNIAGNSNVKPTSAVRFGVAQPNAGVDWASGLNWHERCIYAAELQRVNYNYFPYSPERKPIQGLPILRFRYERFMRLLGVIRILIIS